MRARQIALGLSLLATAGCVEKGGTIHFDVLNELDRTVAVQAALDGLAFVSERESLRPGDTLVFAPLEAHGFFASLDLTTDANVSKSQRLLIRENTYVVARLLPDGVELRVDNEPILHG